MGKPVRVRESCRGAMWGLGAVFLWPHGSHMHRFILAMFVAGIACGGVAVYWPVTAACFPTIIAEFVPLAGRFAYEGDKEHILVGAATLLFPVVLLRIAYDMKSANEKALIFGYANEDLASSLASAREHLQSSVSERTAELSATAKALRDSEEKLRVIIENARDAIMVTQGEMIVFANRSASDLSGYSPEEPASRP